MSSEEPRRWAIETRLRVTLTAAVLVAAVFLILWLSTLAAVIIRDVPISEIPPIPEILEVTTTTIGGNDG